MNLTNELATMEIVCIGKLVFQVGGKFNPLKKLGLGFVLPCRILDKILLPFWGVVVGVGVAAGVAAVVVGKVAAVFAPGAPGIFTP